MKFTLYTASCCGNKANCFYPNHVEVTDEKQLKAAVSFDHVCAEYQNNYRGNDNFIYSDCIVMDIDNDHSENPSHWINEETIEGEFGDVDYALVTSRNHFIEKNGKAARPKFHIYFPINQCISVKEYCAKKTALHKKYNFFDGNALDAARFLFGSDADVVWNEGWLSIEDLIDIQHDAFEKYEQESSSILEGSRNNTMSRFAARVLIRFGDTDKAKEAFVEHSKKCDPPLPNDELDTIWKSAVRFFHKKVENSEGYIPPDEYNEGFNASSLKPDDYSDIGEARALVKEYGSELKFNSATDYIRHNGIYWVENKEYALGALIEFMDLQLVDANDEYQSAKEALVDSGVSESSIVAGGKTLSNEIQSDVLELYYRFLAADKYLKFAMKYRNYKNLINVFSAAKPLLSIDIKELDKDPMLINTPAGTIDLSKGIDSLRGHDASDLITKVTNVGPDDEGKQLWLDALDTFFSGDKSLIDYVQKIVGLAAIGKVYQEHMIIAYGSGANGKSTFWNTISRVLGTYSGKISAEALTMNCKRNVKPEMAELKGKRLIIASEMDEGMRFNTSTIKQLCSTDDIYAEKKYKDPFSFTPSHTLVLYTNHLPRVGANDDGIWRRLVVIPFNAKITGNSDIKNYSDYLFENAGGAIMSWIIEGAKKVIDANYKVELPDVVQQAIESYRGANDWFAHFVEECCEVGKELVAKSGEFYNAYKIYCSNNGEYTRSAPDFNTALENAGFMRKRTKKGMIINGIALKSDEQLFE